MKKYLGVKQVSAEPMSKLNAYLQGLLRVNYVDEDDFSNNSENDPGYKVVYEDGYESWSPKDVFDKAYREVEGMTFGIALEALRKGQNVCREGWNGKGMYLTRYSSHPVNGHLQSSHPDDKLGLDLEGKKQVTQGKSGQMLGFIVMKTAGDSRYWGEGYSDYAPWIPSQSDMSSEDWMVVERD